MLLILLKFWLNWTNQNSFILHSYLLGEAEVEFCRGQDVSQSSETMEQHSSELDDKNERKEKHEYQTNWFQLQIFFWYVYLE